MRVHRGERASFGVPPGSTLLAVSRAMGLLEPIMVRFAKWDGITVDHGRALDIVFVDGNTATILLDAAASSYVRALVPNCRSSARSPTWRRWTPPVR